MKFIRPHMIGRLKGCSQLQTQTIEVMIFHLWKNFMLTLNSLITHAFKG